MAGPHCSVCGTSISTREVRLGQRHLCGGCRKEAQVQPDTAAATPKTEPHPPKYVPRRVPWWESNQRTVVVKYTRPEDFQAEADLAEEHGWHPVAADSHDGRAVGSIGVPALLIALRTLGSIKVVWERPVPVAAPEQLNDPVETLRRLKEMLDLDLIAEDDYEEKKAEVLARM